MPKDIAVVSYDLNPTSSLTTDAVVIRDHLNNNGYSAQLVNQWVFNEPNAAFFKNADYWEKFDGVVICNFYVSWNLRELIKAGRPVMCVNAGYCDDLGLGANPAEHLSLRMSLMWSTTLIRSLPAWDWRWERWTSAARFGLIPFQPLTTTWTSS
jgi:hypothetical protein